MARLHGRSGLVFVSIAAAAAGGTASPIAYLGDWNINVSEDVSDVTPFGDPNHEYIGGIPDITGDFSGFYDDASAQLYLAARDGQPRSFYLYPSFRADPAQYWFGWLIADFSPQSSVAAPVSVKANWKAASSIFRNEFTGIPPTNGNVAGLAAAITVLGGTGAFVTSSNIHGVAAAVTVLGGSGTAGSAPANIAGVAAAVTVLGGTGIPSAGVNVAGAAAAVTALGGTGVPAGHGLHTDTFSSATSSTWLCPPGVTSVAAGAWGPGGAGGAGATTGTPARVGGGSGGGGEYAGEATLTVTPGNSYNYTVGASGSSSTFGPDDLSVTVTAHSGGAGGAANSGTGAAGTAGSAGTGSSNSVHHDGGAGHAGAGSFSVNGAGGGGGSSAGPASAGNAGGTPPAAGSAVSGGGAGGAGGASSGANGTAGSGPGGGGGGGSATSHPGGGGADGQITVTYST